MPPDTMKIASSDAEITACWSVMKQLRPQLSEADFLRRVARQHESEGYQLAYLRNGTRLATVAGFHISECLAVGRYLYIDDLVTSEEVRSKGHGADMLEWLCVLARREGCNALRLDSGLQRVGARRFYEKNGMTVSGYHFLKDLRRFPRSDAAESVESGLGTESCVPWTEVTKMQPVRLTLENGDSLLVREVQLEDVTTVLEYVETIAGESNFLSFGPGEHGFTESEEKTFIQDCLAKDNMLFLIGSIDGYAVSLIGFRGGNRPRTAHTGEFGMSVRRSHWGRGIGSIMLDTLIDWGKKSDKIAKINLRVRTDNQRAIELYERKGFEKEGTIRREVLLNGKFFDHHWMGLNV